MPPLLIHPPIHTACLSSPIFPPTRLPIHQTFIHRLVTPPSTDPSSHPSVFHLPLIHPASLIGPPSIRHLSISSSAVRPRANSLTHLLVHLLIPLPAGAHPVIHPLIHASIYAFIHTSIHPSTALGLGLKVRFGCAETQEGVWGNDLFGVMICARRSGWEPQS